jgi:4-cresol dehydrogenase (hydroxylating)
MEVIVEQSFESAFPNSSLSKSQAEQKYGTNTLGVNRRILGALKPESVEELQRIVQWASETKTRLSVFSTGRNWGYGSSTPAQDECLILDLSKMNKILHHDEELGTVTVQPGVTQQMLFDFLQSYNSELMVPTTGAGPSGSLLGNALDRGFGITPIEDHFSAVLSLEAVLPSGKIYRSAMKDFGGEQTAEVFKWKIGPYLDGLFAQSNIGIVTQVTIALKRRTESIEQFIIYIQDSDLEAAVDSIRNLRHELGGVCGGINLMNQRRVISMMDTYLEWPVERTLSDEELSQWAAKKSVGEWVIMGALYGPRSVTKAAKNHLRRKMKPVAKRMVFLNRRRITLAQKVLRYLPNKKVSTLVNKLSDGLTILEGVPSKVALPLAFLKARGKSATSDMKALDQEGCGLIWFAPIVPLKGEFVREYYSCLTKICLAHDIEPLFTFTSITERCLDATIPILFDAHDPAAVKRAHACLHQLLIASQSFGIFPYRMDMETQRHFFRKEENTELPVALDMYSQIKRALDPNLILSPGKYSVE